MHAYADVWKIKWYHFLNSLTSHDFLFNLQGERYLKVYRYTGFRLHRHRIHLLFGNNVNVCPCCSIRPYPDKPPGAICCTLGLPRASLVSLPRLALGKPKAPSYNRWRQGACLAGPLARWVLPQQPWHVRVGPGRQRAAVTAPLMCWRRSQRMKAMTEILTSTHEPGNVSFYWFYVISKSN